MSRVCFGQTLQRRKVGIQKLRGGGKSAVGDMNSRSGRGGRHGFQG